MAKFEPRFFCIELARACQELLLSDVRPANRQYYLHIFFRVVFFRSVKIIRVGRETVLMHSCPEL